MTRRFVFILILLSVALACALALLASGKLSRRDTQRKTLIVREDGRDVVTVWNGVILGRFDDIAATRIVDNFNKKNKEIYIQLEKIPYALYLPKINIAIATGQPPDVAPNAFSAVQRVRIKQKGSDLSVPIPESMISAEQRRTWGPACLTAITYLGRKICFPNDILLGGEVFQGNLDWFEKAGVDIKYYLENGWDYETFIREMKKVQAVIQQEKGPDAYAFGTNLVNIDTLFYSCFLPQVLGVKASKEGYIVFDETKGHYIWNPAITAEKLALPMGLMQRMIQKDKIWGERFLGMQFSEIAIELTKKRQVAAILANTPGQALALQIYHNLEHEKGLVKARFRATIIPAPVPKAGMPLVFSASSQGWGVMKQIPYRGDAHTSNALKVAQYLASPEALAEVYKEKKFYETPFVEYDAIMALAPGVKDPIRSDPWLNYLWSLYIRWTKSPNVFCGFELVPKQEKVFEQLGQEIMFDNSSGYLSAQGHQILESVLYGKEDPLAGARKMIEGLDRRIDRFYSLHPEYILPPEKPGGDTQAGPTESLSGPGR